VEVLIVMAQFEVTRGWPKVGGVTHVMKCIDIIKGFKQNSKWNGLFFE
jgi:hypothetical protein